MLETGSLSWKRINLSSNWRRLVSITCGFLSGSSSHSAAMAAQRLCNSTLSRSRGGSRPAPHSELKREHSVFGRPSSSLGSPGCGKLLSTFGVPRVSVAPFLHFPEVRTALASSWNIGAWPLEEGSAHKTHAFPSASLSSCARKIAEKVQGGVVVAQAAATLTPNVATGCVRITAQFFALAVKERFSHLSLKSSLLSAVRVNLSQALSHKRHHAIRSLAELRLAPGFGF